MMYKIIQIIMFCLATIPGIAQQITNIRVRQESDNVVIIYDLTGGQPEQLFDINVAVSADKGKTYQIVPNTLIGDLINVTSGNNKQIIWNVLNDRIELAGEAYIFKLVASLKNLNFTDKYSSLYIEMVFVQGGTFKMGSTNGESDEQPVHKVTLNNFYIGKYEITQTQWETVMGSNPSYFLGANLPVERVNWNVVQQFIQKLNRLTGKNYRLPTEAEWEYAARGGSKSSGYTFSGANTLGDVGWYFDNSGNQNHPVGQKQANELGIFDMSGNVWEWCFDWYGSYNSGSQINPFGPATGSDRVRRGGSWNPGKGICRVTFRSYYTPDYGNDILGFRLALPSN